MLVKGMLPRNQDRDGRRGHIMKFRIKYRAAIYYLEGCSLSNEFDFLTLAWRKAENTTLASDQGLTVQLQGACIYKQGGL
jgi:hypothetical protein